MENGFTTDEASFYLFYQESINGLYQMMPMKKQSQIFKIYIWTFNSKEIIKLQFWRHGESEIPRVFRESRRWKNTLNLNRFILIWDNYSKYRTELS